MSDPSQIKEVCTRQLGRTYYVLDFLKTAKIAEAVNARVPKAQFTAELDGYGPVNFTLGQLFEIMVLNRLYGLKTPLYHIGEWCEHTAIPEIYGLPAALLTDDRIGDLLDRIEPYLETIDSEITLNMIRAYDLAISQIHFDPSSFAVCGDYTPVAGEPSTIKITYGRNGQGRYDDKLVRFGLAITKADAFPLLAKGYSGNTSDAEMHPEFLTQLRQVLARSDFLFIADSKLDTTDNLVDIMSHHGYFLCPGAFSQHWKEAFLDDYQHRYQFTTLDYVPKAERKRPKSKRHYFQAFERPETIVVKPRGDQAAQTYEYRLLFVYSSMKAKAEAHFRQKSLKTIQDELRQLTRRLNKRGHQTHKEATAKLGVILKRPASKFFDVNLNGTEPHLTLDYAINAEALARAKQLDGVYLLKTNLPQAEYSLNDLLTLYKKQGQIEQKIADLKGPLQVAPMYLKKTQRILALFTIIVQALKIYTLIEREVYQAIQARGERIPILPEDRLSARPKAVSILRLFDEHPLTLATITWATGAAATYLSALSDKQKMLFQFVNRKPPDRRTFSRKIGIYRSAKAQNHVKSGDTQSP